MLSWPPVRYLSYFTPAKTCVILYVPHSGFRPKQQTSIPYAHPEQNEMKSKGYFLVAFSTLSHIIKNQSNNGETTGADNAEISIPDRLNWQQKVLYIIMLYFIRVR